MALLVLILAVLFALSPLASDGFNGFTPAQFPVVNEDWPIQPAGWAFSIWGVIYLWLIAGCVVGVWRARHAPDWAAMRPALALSLGVGVFWIAAANRSPPLATAMIVVMAGAAVAALWRTGRTDAVWQRAPVGFYAGWLTAATGVAIGVLLGGYGVLSPQAAALVMLPLILIAALIVQRRRPDALTYPLAVGWALVGIAADNLRGGST
ncbi:hypothetical protein, partial [Paracoccus sanguinis]